MNEINIIGYDSDSVYQSKEDYRNKCLARYNILDKIKVNKNVLEIEARKNSIDRECHVYLINGEKTYYKIYREPNELTGYEDVKYLGIGLEPNLSIKEKLKKIKPKKGLAGKGLAGIGTSYYKSGMKCCYCEIELDKFTCTREHVIPKHRGGKIIIPCCGECNGEKGGLMLHSYIQILCCKDFKHNDHGFEKNQIKIKNCNEIAKLYDL